MVHGWEMAKNDRTKDLPEESELQGVVGTDTAGIIRVEQLLQEMDGLDVLEGCGLLLGEIVTELNE